MTGQQADIFYKDVRKIYIYIYIKQEIANITEKMFRVVNMFLPACVASSVFKHLGVQQTET